METINYQGQQIEAQLVNYVCGDGIATSTPKEFSGEEELLRDEAGRYYLRQRIDHVDPVGNHEHDDLIKASGRTRVHRINVNAAILWAATRLNSVTLDLRNDAAALLMEGRGYTDPPPSHLSKEQRALINGAEDNQQAHPRRCTVQLDELASAMLRKNVREGSGTKEAGEDPRDMVNAAVTFYLCDESDYHVGEFNLEMGDEALERAKRDRLALESATPPPTKLPEPTASDEADGLTRLMFYLEARPDRAGGSMKLAVTKEQMAQAKRLAPHFGMDARQFLALLSVNALPDQPHADEPMSDLLRTECVRFACSDKNLMPRIHRAAKASGQSLAGFVAAAVSSWVEMYEEEMIVHPRTGRLLHVNGNDLYTCEKHEITAAPTGKEQEPQWKRTLQRQHVQFSAHLTPEQMERLEYPHMVHDHVTDRELPCVLIPYDAEQGLPFLTINGRDVAPSEWVPPTVTIPVFSTEQLSRMGREGQTASTASEAGKVVA